MDDPADPDRPLPVLRQGLLRRQAASVRREAERGDGSPSDSALEILDRRYARGEIDEEEHERKRKTITREKRGETR